MEIYLKLTDIKLYRQASFLISKIGKPVSSKSQQGIFIEKILGRHINIFEDAVNNQLKGQHIDRVQRIDGKNLKYKLGTTITIKHNQDFYFIFALTNTDNDCNANSIPSLMFKALEGLWNKVRIEGNGVDFNLPLICNGLSRIGLHQEN